MIDSPKAPLTRRIRDTLLTVGAVLGSLCIVATLLAWIFDLTTLVFRSGSMEPTIRSGAVAVARTVPATELEAGDVVSVINDQGNRVTHRIVAIDATAGNTALLTLAGDANSEPDPRPYGVVSADRVLFHVDGVGYVVMWFSGPAGLLLLGVGAAVLVRMVIRPDGRPLRGTGKHVSPGRQTVPMAICLTTATATVAGLGHVPGTSAAFTDTASARSGPFSSDPEFVPRIEQTVSGDNFVTCENIPADGDGNESVRLTWKHIGPPYEYRIVLRDRDRGGNVWQSWDVTDVQAEAGADIFRVIDATGLPDRDVDDWSYDAEIHTVLPDPPLSTGAVSTSWRGVVVRQGRTDASGNHMFCEALPDTGSDAPYIPGPAALTCTDVDMSAALTWPHLGSPYRYRVTVRDASGGVLWSDDIEAPNSTTGSDVTHAVPGEGETATVPAGDLVAEVRTLGPDSTGVYVPSGEYRAFDLVAAEGVSCVSAATPDTASPPLPDVSATVTPDSPAPDSTPQSPTTTSPDDDSTTASPSTEPSAPSTAEETVDPAPSEQTLGSPVTASTGNYTARLVATGAGAEVVITAATGREVYRTGATTSDSLRWLPGTDELRIEGPSGTWSVSAASGTWTKTAVVEPPPPAPSEPEAPPAESAPTPETAQAPPPVDEGESGSVTPPPSEDGAEP